MKPDIDKDLILKLNREFHDEVEADTYDARMGVVHDAESIRRIVDELETVLGGPLPLTGVVVDAASGTGNLALKLASHGHYDRVCAVDISARSLEVASRNADALGVRIETLVSEMVRLPFDDGSVDLVVGCAFLHHLPDPPAFMQEVARILRPGGAMIVIGEPTAFGARALYWIKLPLVLANRLLRLLRKTETFRWDHDNIDVHSFTKADARRLLAPFVRTRIVTQGFLAPLVDQGILTPIRTVTGAGGRLGRAFDGLTRGLRALDRWVFDRAVPRFGRISLKISGYKG
jgi:SAM-dependent methyltransferase